jgi:hypothetical protein
MTNILLEKSVQYFKPKKLLILSGLLFLVGTILALLTPLLLGKNNAAFTLGGIIFFVFPLGYLIIYKRKYIYEGKVIVGQDYLQFTEKDIETMIRLYEIGSFSVELTGQNFAGLTYRVSLLLKDAKKLSFFLVENDLFDSDNNISANSILFNLALCFKKFNEQPGEKDGTEIKLLNQSEISKNAWLLFSIPLVVAGFDIYYRIQHPEASQKAGIFLIIMSFFLSLALLAKVKGYSNFGKKVAAILEE